MQRVLVIALLLSAACGRREAPTGRWAVGPPDAAPTASNGAGGKTMTPPAPGPPDAAAEPDAQAPQPLSPPELPGGARDGSARLDDPRAAIIDASSDADARPCVDGGRCD